MTARQIPIAQNNLWKPLPGDWGAHGEFDDRAHGRSWQNTLNRNRRWVALGLLAAGAVAALFREPRAIAGEVVKDKAA